MSKVFVFFREDHFYIVGVPDDQATAKHAAEHAALNPGTLRVEDERGTILWEAA